MAFSFFFRDLHVLELACKYLVPHLTGRSRPTIWDAGCAMGQEPYTLAMVLADQMSKFGFTNLRLFATDLDDTGTFGDIVTKAEYPKGDLERIPEDAFKKYVEPCGDRPGYYRISSYIRDRLTFQQHDLLSLKPIGSNFSFILCKNVLLHFQPAQRVQVIQMFHDSLTSGGFIAFEQTQKMPEELQPLFEQLSADGQVFQKRS